MTAFRRFVNSVTALSLLASLTVDHQLFLYLLRTKIFHLLCKPSLRFAVILRIIGKLQELSPRTRLVVALHRFTERSDHREDTDAFKPCRVSYQGSVLSSGSDSVRHLPRENGKIISPRLSLFIPLLIIAFSVIHMIFICSTSAGLSSLFW